MTVDINAIKKELDRLNNRFLDIWEEEDEYEDDILEEMGEDFDELHDLIVEAGDGYNVVHLGDKYCILATEFFSSTFDYFEKGLPSAQDFRIVRVDNRLDFDAYYRDEKINPLFLLYDNEMEYFFECDAKAFGKVVAYLLNEPNLYLITEYNEQT